MDLDDAFVGGRIKKLRESNNMSQRRFSAQLHITQQTLSRYENGITPVPYTVLSNISVEFKMPMGYFFGISTDNISEDEFMLVDYYRKIDDRLKESVLKLIKTMVDDF